MSLAVIRRGILALFMILAVLSGAQAQDRYLVLASTTSTQQSGLFDHILPLFTKDTGIAVRVVAVGTGQAIQIGQRGDADALLIHDRAGEDKFVADGYGLDRRDIMYNDFVLVGPKSDPAGIMGSKDVTQALRKIADGSVPFASRGDDSGTHRMELRLWQEAGVDVRSRLTPWYRQLGQGMGPTLNIAASMDAYVLTDRATWANFKNRQGLIIVVEGEKRLLNPYASILVNPQRFATLHKAEAEIWHAWLSGPQGRAAITSYRLGGEPVFFIP